MLVDWFTTVAQIINFLILVSLLKHFLYKPVLRAMDERENRMIRALKDAEQQKVEAESERLAFERKSQELVQQKEQLLKGAAEQAEKERKRMISTAREEVAALQAQWREAIAHEKAMLLDEITARIETEIFAVSGQVLSDLAGTNLEACIAERFTERLKTLEPGERDRLVSTLGTSPNAAMIRSAFELSESSRRQIQQAIKQNLSAVPEIQFVTTPKLIAGIELSANGHKVSWTIKDYLASLQQELGQSVDKKELEHVQPTP